METSIIIRVKNERTNLKKLLGILRSQTYQDFEIVLVDNESTDGSTKIIFDFFPGERIQVVKITDFSYPKACNLGAQVARGKYLVYLSAHSYPVSLTWLKSGIDHLKDKEVAGVSAFPIWGGKEGSIWEKMFFNSSKYLLAAKVKKVNIGNTNSVIKKDLWEKHHFDESLKVSEDLEWSLYWKKRGYKIINEPKFAVYHSHRWGPLGILKAEIFWHKQNLKFRNARY